MSTFFTEILNLSVISSFLIFAVLVLRMLIKKAPKGIRYIFWAMVGLRLLFPFSFESRFSMLPNAQSFNTSVETSTAYVTSTSVASQQIAENNVSLSSILPYIWLGGVFVMLLYMLISFIRVRLMVREAVPYKDNIYMCDHVRSPFVLGFVNPKIYLPSSMSKREMNLVILHERTHIKHCDNIWKPLSFLLLSVYWFNPLCWVAYFLFVKDIELFCDESVTKTLSPTARKKYSYALLGFSKRQTNASACPLAFAENNVKTRVRSVLTYKKPALYVVIISVAMCVVTMLTFMSSPVSVKVLREYNFPTSLSQVMKQVEDIAPTEPPTEKPTEKKAVKKTKTKKEKKTEEPQQEYNDNSYDYSYGSSDNTDEFVPLRETEAYKKRFEYYTTIFGDSSQSFEPDPEPYVEVPPNLTPYEGEMVWDKNSSNVSGFN